MTNDERNRAARLRRKLNKLGYTMKKTNCRRNSIRALKFFNGVCGQFFPSCAHFNNDGGGILASIVPLPAATIGNL